MTDNLILKPKPTRIPVKLEPQIKSSIESDSHSVSELENPQRATQKHYWTKEEVLSHMIFRMKN